MLRALFGLCILLCAGCGGSPTAPAQVQPAAEAKEAVIGANTLSLNGRVIWDRTPPISAAVLSPDGRQVCCSVFAGLRWGLWLLNADGSNLRQITNEDADDKAPQWSADGQTIFFQRNGVPVSMPAP